VTSEQPTVIRPPAKPPTSTAYTILRRVEPDTWNTIGTTNARTNADAIRTVVGRLPETEQAGTYVAMPSRSFQPFEVVVTTETKLTLGEAKS
jgi:hypothetical protein